jgi:hypothetical protein
MIHVVIEIWPHGIETRKREIARMDLGNISEFSAVSSYVVQASSAPNPLAKHPTAFSARGVIEGHRRDDSIWILLAKATDWLAHLARQS